MSNMSAVFNVAKLIEEVKKRPKLYKPEHKTDREDRLALWKDVGAAIHCDWPQINKATAYDRVLQMQKKWRSLRDAYNRELRARRKGTRVNQRVYMHFKRLSFLGGFDGIISDENEIEDDNDGNNALPEHSNEAMFEHSNEAMLEPSNEAMLEHIVSDADPLISSDPPPSLKKRKRRRVKKETIHNPPEEIEMPFPVEMTEGDGDSDRLFLLSFLPEMRQLPVNVKMWARAQIANIMQEAVASQYSNCMPSSDRNSLGIKRQRLDSSD